MNDRGHGTFSVTVLSPDGGNWAQVCVAGQIDLAAATELAATIDLLRKSPARFVFVDVAAVTFADVTLPDFCLLLRAALPGWSAPFICRPGPMTRQILEDAGVCDVLAVRDDLPLLDVSGAALRTGRYRRDSRPALRMRTRFSVR
ncbi:hypothetical protein [Paractinoplanes rishiriensis]|nr:hypothetical protein [Actinoplanes rishiriensis]